MQRLAVERRQQAAAALADAERHVARARSLQRLGEMDARDVESARDALAVARERHADAQRDVRGDAESHYQRCVYLETRDRITRNKAKQVEAIRRYADAYALAEQLGEQYQAAELRCRELSDAVSRLTYTHPNVKDSPQSEHADAILSRVREHVKGFLTPAQRAP